MKSLLIVTFCLLFRPFGFGQLRAISPINVKNLEVKALTCIDSTGKKISVCSLDLDGFLVKLYEVFFDTTTAELRIVGRLSPDHAYVGIFLGTQDSIPLNVPLSRTSYDKEYLNNDGFFDVSFIIKPETVLYFYERGYFARQFNISKLLRQK